MRRKRHATVTGLLFAFLLVINIFTPSVSALTGKEHNTTQNEMVQLVEETITIEEAIAIASEESIVTVRGFIVGHANNGNVKDEATNDHNVVIATSADEKDINKMISIQLAVGDRPEFGLVTNPGIIGLEVIVSGKLNPKYNGLVGLKKPVTIIKADNGPVDPEVPEELEIISVAEARAQEKGRAKIKGTVMGRLKNAIIVQDATAGIAVRPTSLDLNLGEEVVLEGNLASYNGLLQLDPATIVEKTGTINDVDATAIDGSQLTKDNQSKLVEIKKVKITDVQDGGTWANYTAEDEDGNIFLVRDESNVLELTVGSTYDSITGIVSHFYDEAQLIPRNSADIVADATVVQAVFATPAAGTVPSGTKVELKTYTKDASIFYTLDNGDPALNGIEYKEAIVLEKNTTIRAIAKKDGMTTSILSLMVYDVYDAEDGIQIHNIQGASHTSPMDGQVVQDVEGVVTYTYDIRGSHYFHIQALEENYDSNPKTSEAIVIYTGKKENVTVGDYVGITGTVSEYAIDGYDDKEQSDLPITQINARNDKGGVIEVKERNIELPAPIKITSSNIPKDIIGDNVFVDFEPESNALDFWESIEGMRVEVAPSKLVAPQAHGDLVVVTDEMETNTVNGGIMLEKSGPNAQTIQFKVQPNDKARDLKVKTGDQFTEALTGVVNYGFGNYKIYADLADVEAALVESEVIPHVSSIVKDEDKLTIASYNMENYSANTSKNETPNSKSMLIAESFVDVMMSPDIIGLIEVQDNNGGDEGPEDADASESYERLIADIIKAGGPSYEFVNINPEYNQDGGKPNGNIRVGYLYNSDRVSLIEAKHGSPTEAVSYEDGKLTLNPGRVEPMNPIQQSSRKPLAAQFEFNGETVVVVANHLNSKLGDDGFWGKNQPPVIGSEPKRIELARMLNAFASDILEDNPEENIVILGDMNDFEFSKPLQELKGNLLTNMVDLVPEESRYSYVYQGNSQVLDHVLVSNNRVEQTEIDMIHVNADYTEMHGRASDHDAVLVQMDLRELEDTDIPWTPLEPSNPIEKEDIPWTPLQPSKPIKKPKPEDKENEKLPATGMENNIKVVLISSGMVALGLSAVYLDKRRKDHN